MDYGIRLFRHVVQQVFGNLGNAVKITALPFMLFLVIAYLLVGNLFLNDVAMAESGEITQEQFEAQFGSQQEMLRRGLRMLWMIPIGLVLFGWAAVAWHRYVLADESVGFVPGFATSRVLGYVWRTILISLVLLLLIIAIMIPVGLLFGGLIGLSGGPGLGGFELILGMGLSFLLSWILVRWSLILPAWSVDEKMTIGESWGVTKDVSGEILVPILGFAIIFPIIQQILVLLPLGGVITILSLLVFWIQMLVNLALLTTLYGNLVQGRELN